MSTLKIATKENQTRFTPGAVIDGVAGWQLDQPPSSVELRLFYHTEGKGTEEVYVVETVPFQNPQQEEARPFQVRLPDSPYSCSGTLISLIWSLEVVAKPSDDSARLEISMSPSGEEILLT